MKKLLLLSLSAVLLASCGEEKEVKTATIDGETVSYYGEEITPENAISVEELDNKMANNTSLNTKVEGKIIETCGKKGCWMSVDMGDGDDMLVTFKDYGFFVPTEGVGGKTAVFEGVCVHDTLSVDWLRHVAEDAGRSQEEIEAITEPEIALAFEATGVIIKE